MKLDWRAVLGLAITVLLLWWLFRGEDPAQILGAIARADLGLLLAAIVVTTSGFLVRAFRWKVLLHPLRPDTGLRARFAAVNIGFMANNLLPARVGEFARAYALSRMEPVSVSGAFGSLVVERFLDAVTLIALLIAVLVSPGFPQGATILGQPVTLALRGVVFVLAVGLAGMVVLLVWPRRVVRLAERVLRRLPEPISRRLVDTLEAFLDGLGSLQDIRLLVLGLGWTLAFWMWNAFSFWLGFKAFGIHESFVAAVFVQCVVALFVAIPSSPGFFGVFHAGAVVGLSEVYGVGQALTLSFAVGYHLGGFIPVTVIGLYYAGRIGLSLGEMRQSEERVEAAVEAAHPEVLQKAGDERPGTPLTVIDEAEDDSASAGKP